MSKQHVGPDDRRRDLGLVDCAGWMERGDVGSDVESVVSSLRISSRVANLLVMSFLVIGL